MILQTTIAIVRTSAERAMKKYRTRMEIAAALEDCGDLVSRRIAEWHLQELAELLSIENHLNGVSPE